MCPATGIRARPGRPAGLTRIGALALLSLWALAGASDAFAHGRSVSYSTWEIEESGALISIRMKLLELSRLGPQALPPGSVSAAGPPGTPDLPARAFPTELILVADDEVCSPDPIARRRPDEPGWVRYEWRVSCPENPNRLAIRSRVLLAVAPSHMHFARARFASASESVREQVLTEARPEFVLREIGHDDESEAPHGIGLLDYFVLGVKHIGSGWDHLAFVFGLLLLSHRLGEVGRLITGFTVAHSLTLALAVLELVHPRAAAVEAVIAFSVALVAIEKGWHLSGRPHTIPAVTLAGLFALAVASLAGLVPLPLLTVLGLLVFTACYFSLVRKHDSEWLRVSLTFAFGLVHGFGFAGTVVEWELPTERLVPALLGFNLGVEAGQIGFVLLAWPLLSAGRRWARADLARLAGELSAAALCGLGLFWLVERALTP